MRRALAVLVALIAVAAVGLWILSAPRGLDTSTLSAAAAGDAARGERIFNAAGCSSCHSRPGGDAEARLQLAGGLELATDFGTFVAPNISQHPEDGIGAWSSDDFANAVLRGVSPRGAHYYPAFPYGSYARMRPEDVGDLFAYMKTLPAVAGRAPESDLSFPFSVRRGIGLWKLVNLDTAPFVAPQQGESETIARGRYLVEGLGHCGECHTPRTLAQGLDGSRWLAGAKAAEGEGNVPNITGGEGGIGDWSESDLVTFFESGFTPEFDSVGGSMAAVQANLARLPEADRAAIAAYLKAIPPHPNGY